MSMLGVRRPAQAVQPKKHIVATASKASRVGRKRTACHGILDSYRQAQAGTQAAVHDHVESTSKASEYSALAFESTDEDICPAECVVEVQTPTDFKAKCEEAGDAVVVLDLYKTSCGACKYLMPGFLNMCKDSYSEDLHSKVVFLKHNVLDEEDEKTDLARRLRVQGVPKFMIFKSMELIEEFSTRDKQQLIKAVKKHTRQSAADLGTAQEG